MDKKSIIGYVLIGLVLFLYFQYSQPSAEEVKAEKQRIENQKQEQERKEIQQKAANEAFIAQKDSVNSLFYNVLKGENKRVTLQNSKLKIDISTYGGRVASATLKDYKDQEGEDLVLFDSRDKINQNDKNRELNGSNTINFAFDSNSGKINTNELFFTPVNASDKIGRAHV